MIKNRMIIAGSRGFDDYKYLSEVLDSIITDPSNTVIISGCDKGDDKLGEKYAEEHGIELHKEPARRQLYGRSAGYIRNAKMAEQAHSLVAFWNGESRVTKNMIDLATGLKLEVIVHIIK